MSKPINRILAENLLRCMAVRGISTQQALAKRAGLSQRAIGYYLHPEQRPPSKSGKEPSAKLAELEQLARALGTEPWDLLRDLTDSERAFYAKIEAAYQSLREPPTD